jgi:PleD family two-component response regulator
MERKFKTKIFLVDDNPFSLRMYQQHLANLGYADVSIHSDGYACLDRLKDHPEVIFLDHNMQEIDGFEVLKKIKRVDPNIYVVMLSGQERMETAVDALKYGAFDYIIKGESDVLRMEEVLNRIDHVRDLLRRAKPSFFRRILSIF